jgi:hypothetical protein
MSESTTPVPDEAAAARVYMPLDAVLLGYRDGDERGWREEFCWLEAHHRSRLDVLYESVRTGGMQQPILLGDDGRVWDGHHRLWVADRLGLGTVPVTFAALTSQPAPTPVPAELASLDRDDRDIIKAQLIRRIHGVQSISDFPSVAESDMALAQAGDVIDIALAAALPVLLAAEREAAAHRVESLIDERNSDRFNKALRLAAACIRRSDDHYTVVAQDLDRIARTTTEGLA